MLLLSSHLRTKRSLCFLNLHNQNRRNHMHCNCFHLGRIAQNRKMRHKFPLEYFLSSPLYSWCSYSDLFRCRFHSFLHKICMIALRPNSIRLAYMECTFYCWCLLLHRLGTQKHSRLSFWGNFLVSRQYRLYSDLMYMNSIEDGMANTCELSRLWSWKRLCNLWRIFSPYCLGNRELGKTKHTEIDEVSKGQSNLCIDQTVDLNKLNNSEHNFHIFWSESRWLVFPKGMIEHNCYLAIDILSLDKLVLILYNHQAMGQYNRLNTLHRKPCINCCLDNVQ